MLASVRSATLLGIDGHSVEVETHLSQGLPAFNVVGLPDVGVRESRDRVRAALLSSGLPWPLKRITVNLAPGSVPKAGSGLDLAVALGILAVEGVIPLDRLDETAAFAELGLDGTLRPCDGVLALGWAAARDGAKRLIVAPEDAVEAGLLPGVEVLTAPDLDAVVRALKCERPWDDVPPEHQPAAVDEHLVDLGHIRGHHLAIHCAMLSAAGGHHLLLSGPPGIGKSMIAQGIESIMPPLDDDGALELTRIYSAAGLAPLSGVVRRRPFRRPHHTVTTVALLGGGSARLRPGEVTLAHRGTLFLDELGEFRPQSLDALRQPLEEGVVRIARSRVAAVFPASFALVACTNPCPCGLGPPRCSCSEDKRDRYRRRLSEPLLDRFDMRLALTPPTAASTAATTSEKAALSVANAAERATRRLAGTPWRRNSEVPGHQIAKVMPLPSAVEEALRHARSVGKVSERGATRSARLAWTIADLAGRDQPSLQDALLACDLREATL
ncbi:MAG: YifB family Mg chelatase-like AAA ATPase [Acidimicrobiia bacterium]|nr:YifB family Mg chelatase-like AAA ATPase [Acidimicrobiia bacterium]